MKLEVDFAVRDDVSSESGYGFVLGDFEAHFRL